MLLVHADVRILLVVTHEVNFEVALRAEPVAANIAFVWTFAYRMQQFTY